MSDFVVGLTGGIGSGKSTATDCFAAHGISVVDTDAIAHEFDRRRRGRNVGAAGRVRPGSRGC